MMMREMIELCSRGVLLCDRAGMAKTLIAEQL